MLWARGDKIHWVFTSEILKRINHLKVDLPALLKDSICVSDNNLPGYGLLGFFWILSWPHLRRWLCLFPTVWLRRVAAPNWRPLMWWLLWSDRAPTFAWRIWPRLIGLWVSNLLLQVHLVIFQRHVAKWAWEPDLVAKLANALLPALLQGVV